MALNDLVSLSITLQSSAVSREGFGTPLFAAKHRYFPERTRSYGSLSASADDLPSTSNPYQALTGIFSQSPQVSAAIVGRIEADQVLTPDSVEDGSTHTVTIVISDGTSFTATYTAGATDDAEAVVDALKTAIDAETDIAAEVSTTKTGTGSDTTLTLSAIDPDNGDTFYTPYESIEGLVDTYESTEAAADVLSNIQDYDDDWYVMMTEDHSETFVLAMAAAIEATGDKLYFVSTSEASSLTAYTSSPTDIIGQLTSLEYDRTVAMWHQDADEKFVEAYYAGKNLPYDAGSVNWANIQLSGLDAAKQSNGNYLTSSQQNYLEARNCNFIQYYRDVSIVRLGRCVSGESIDTIRGYDWMSDTISADMSDLLINQAGGKVSYDDTGIARIENVLTSSLQKAVDRNFIDEDFTVSVPSASDVSSSDKLERILRDVTFSADLVGAINTVEISGTLNV